MMIVIWLYALFIGMGLKQARKSSEDAQATRYAQFEKVWAGSPLGQKKVWTQNTCILAIHFLKNTLSENILLENTLLEITLSENTHTYTYTHTHTCTHVHTHRHTHTPSILMK